MEKQDLRALTYDRLIEITLDLEFPKYRGDQLFSWLHEKAVSNLSEISNLPKDYLEAIEENYTLYNLELTKEQSSEVDDTKKYLFKLWDDNAIETVLMSYHHGNSICLSTQVGCRMGCGFCASTIGGLVRNLTAGEMAEQVYMVERLSGKRISNIVLMGIGEPLDNYDETVNFINIISSGKGRNIGVRNIALSTCGLVDKIDELAKLSLSITLCISLHQSDDLKRSEIMPINNKWNIAEVIGSAKRYYGKTSRRVTFEYALIKDENDSLEEADKLGKLLKGFNCHVNLIPINEVKDNKYRRSSNKAVVEFKDRLESYSISTTIRRELGKDISAACGQLRWESLSDDQKLV